MRRLVLVVLVACSGAPGQVSKQPIADEACVAYAQTHGGEVPDIPLRPLAEPKPQELSVEVFRERRFTGERLVVPDDRTKLWMTTHGFRELFAAFRMCVDAKGVPTSVDPIVQSCMPRWDLLLTNALMKWRYEPYVSGGVAAPVCGAVSFRYKQQ